MQGLGGAPLSAQTSRPLTIKGPTLPPPPPFYDDTPTMLPGQMNPLAIAASAARAPTPAPVETPRRYEPVSESTSIDVRLPLGEGPEETTGEDPPPFEDEAPFEDPSPTPPDGMPAVLSSTPDSKGFRLGARLSSAAPPPAPPAEAPKEQPSPQPATSRLRGRTIGHEEAAGLAQILESSQSDGTQMIQLGRGGVGEPCPRAEVPESGDPFANRAFEAPSRPMPVVERTMAIDLSASGVSSDGLAPPNSTLPSPLQFSPPPARNWGVAPEAPQLQPQPAARSMVVWWVVGGVAVAVILMALTIALRA